MASSLTTESRGVRATYLLQLEIAPAQSFISNTSIFRSGGHGIQRAWVEKDVGLTTSFLETNSFEEIDGCRETHYATTGGNICPDPIPCP